MYTLLTILNAAEEIQTATTQQPSLIASIMPIILIMGVFYFLIVRPQNKKYKDHKFTIDETKINDEIITSAGIFGKIVSIEADFYIIEISKDVNVKIYKNSISKNTSLEERLKQNIVKKNAK